MSRVPPFRRYLLEQYLHLHSNLFAALKYWVLASASGMCLYTQEVRFRHIVGVLQSGSREDGAEDGCGVEASDIDS